MNNTLLIATARQAKLTSTRADHRLPRAHRRHRGGIPASTRSDRASAKLIQQYGGLDSSSAASPKCPAGGREPAPGLRDARALAASRDPQDRSRPAGVAGSRAAPAIPRPALQPRESCAPAAAARGGEAGAAAARRRASRRPACGRTGYAGQRGGARARRVPTV
jgi:hypothetical protein